MFNPLFFTWLAEEMSNLSTPTEVKEGSTHRIIIKTPWTAGSGSEVGSKSEALRIKETQSSETE